MIDLGSQIQSQTFSNQSRDSVKRSSASDLVSNSYKKSEKSKDLSATRSDFGKSLNELDSKSPIQDSATAQKGPSAEVPRAESREPKKLEAPQTSDAKRPVTNQVAMEVFLDRMNEEFGIEPEEVLKAFAELSEADLNASPEDSALAFVGKLGLKEEDSTKALSMYNQMLAMTAAAGMSQLMKQNGQEANFQVVDKKEVQLQTLRHSLDDLSDRFFVTGSHAMMKTGVDRQAEMASAYQAQMKMAMKEQSDRDTLVGDASVASENIGRDSSLLIAPSGSALSFDGAQSGAELVTPQLNPVLNAADASEGAIEIPDFEDVDVSTDEVDFDTSSLSHPIPTGSAASTVHLAGGPSLTTPTGAGLQGLAAINGGAGAESSSADSGELGDHDGGESSDSLESQELGGAQSQVANTQSRNNPSQFIVGAPVANDADVQDNVKEIISQAKFLAQKGGGEMKMSLNPQGMGEVSLKVRMVDGNVNVEMITESNEAKKVLEKGLGELKDSLASHKLHLDSIKIESGKEASNKFGDQQPDADRGQQQRFLGDFQQRNSNFRRDMFELPGPNIPSSQTRDQAANNQYDPKAKKRSESSRRLDLVA